MEKVLAGEIALVTGASRGIGEQIARVLHRDGATVLGIDVPQAASELQSVMREAMTIPARSPVRPAWPKTWVATRSRQWARSEASSSAADGRGRTTATTRAPQRSSGTPTTPASSTPGCARRAASTSAG